MIIKKVTKKRNRKEKMKCLACGKEFESKRADARACSPSCRKKLSRTKDSVTDNLDVTDNVISVTNVTDSSVTDNSGLKPASEVFQTPPEKENYYKSKKYLDLIKHLEETSIKDLEKEGTFIPCWKYAGFKKAPTAKEILAVAGGCPIEKLRGN